MSCWKRVQLSFNNCKLCAWFFLPTGINTAATLCLWKFLSKHYCSASVSSRDCMHCWLDKRDCLRRRDVLRRRKLGNHFLSSRQPVHVQQLQNSVSGQQLLRGWFVCGGVVPSSFCISCWKHSLHQLQLPRGDVRPGFKCNFRQLSFMPTGGLLCRAGATVLVLRWNVIKSL